MAVITNGDISGSKDRPICNKALDSFLLINQVHFLFEIKRQKESREGRIRDKTLSFVPGKRSESTNNPIMLSFNDSESIFYIITKLVELITRKLMKRCPKKKLYSLRMFEWVSNKIPLTLHILSNNNRVKISNYIFILKHYRLR